MEDPIPSVLYNTKLTEFGGWGLSRMHKVTSVSQCSHRDYEVSPHTSGVAGLELGQAGGFFVASRSITIVLVFWVTNICQAWWSPYLLSALGFARQVRVLLPLSGGNK